MYIRSQDSDYLNITKLRDLIVFKKYNKIKKFIQLGKLSFPIRKKEKWMLEYLDSSAQDLFDFDADPDPESALEKMDPEQKKNL